MDFCSKLFVHESAPTGLNSERVHATLVDTQGVTPNAPAPLTGDVQGVASTLATPDPPQGSELAAAEGAYLKGPRAAHAFAKTVMKLQSDKVPPSALREACCTGQHFTSRMIVGFISKAARGRFSIRRSARRKTNRLQR